METQSGSIRPLSDRLTSKKDRHKEHRLSKASIGQPMKFNKNSDSADQEGSGSSKYTPSMIMKCVFVHKDENGYGLTVSGDNPVYVQSVKPDGAAQKAGVVQGDRIIKVNGATVTDCNHVEVVRHIKAASYVALTLLGVPKPPNTSSASTDVEGTQTSGEYITGPKGPAKTHFYDQKVETIKKMLKQEVVEVERIKEEYAKNPSPKLLADLGTAQKLKQDLEKQLWKVESMKDESLQAAEAPSLPSLPSHVTDVDECASTDTGDEDTSLMDIDFLSSTDERDASVREQRSNTLNDVLPDQHSLGSFPGSMKSEDTGSLGLLDDIQQTIMSNHVQNDGPKTPGLEQNRKIMNFEDDDIANEEDGVLDHGPFNDLDTLCQRPAYLAVFLKYVCTTHDPSNLLFTLAVDTYRQMSSAKEMVKHADFLMKTYLSSNSVLKVNVDEAITRSIQTTVHAKNPAEETLRGVFDPAVQVSNKEVRNQLSQYRIKREQGLGNLFGDEKLEEVDNQPDSRIVDDIISQMLADMHSPISDDAEMPKWILIQDALNMFLTKYGSKRKSRISQKVYSMLRTKPQQPSLAKSKMYGGSQESVLEDGSKKPSAFMNLIGGKKKMRSDSNAADSKRHQDRQASKKHKSPDTIWENAQSILQPTKVSVPPGSIPSIGGASSQQHNLSQSLDHGSGLDSAFEKRDSRPAENRKSFPGGKPSIRLSHSPVRSRSVPSEELQRAEEMQTGYFEQSAGMSTQLPIAEQATVIAPTISEEMPESGIVSNMVSRYQDTSPTGSGETPSTGQTLGSSLTPDSGQKPLRQTRSGSFRRHRDDEKRVSGQSKSRSDPDKNKVEQAVVQHISSEQNDVPNSTDVPSDETKEKPILPSVTGDMEINVDASEQHWSETVPGWAVKAIDRREVKRQEVINELIYTEQHHVRDLKILEKVFYEPLRKQNLFTEDEIFHAFPNLQTVLQMHRVFNEALQKAKDGARDHGYVVKNIGDIVLDRFNDQRGNEFKEECAHYCGNQSAVLSMIKEKSKKDQKLNQFLEDMQRQPVCRKLHLKDFVPMEFQRLTKYPLLLENIMKNTHKKKQESELEKIRKASERCREILAFVNQTVKEAEDKQKILEIQTNLDRTPLSKVSSSHASSYDLVQQYKSIDLTKRHVVHHGQLTWRVGQMDKRKEIQLHCVLFEDLLILLQRQDDRYTLKCQSSTNGVLITPFLKTDKLIVRNVATDKRAFFAMSTHGGPQMYEFVAKSSGDVKQWMKHITDTIALAKKQDTTSASHRRKGFRVPETSRDISDDDPMNNAVSAGTLVGSAQENHPDAVKSPGIQVATSLSITEEIPLSNRLQSVHQEIVLGLDKKHKLLAEAAGVDEAMLDEILEMSPEDSEPEPKTLVMHSLLCVDKLTKLLNECMVPEQIVVRRHLEVAGHERERSSSNRSSIFGALDSTTSQQSEPDAQSPQERWAVPVSRPSFDSPASPSTSTQDILNGDLLAKSPSSDSFARVSTAGNHSNHHADESLAASDSDAFFETSEQPFVEDSTDNGSAPPATGDETSADVSLSELKPTAMTGLTVDEGAVGSRPASAYDLLSKPGISVQNMMEIMNSLQTQLTRLMHVTDERDLERQKIEKENHILREQLAALEVKGKFSNSAPPSYSDAVQDESSPPAGQHQEQADDVPPLPMTSLIHHFEKSRLSHTVSSPSNLVSAPDGAAGGYRATPPLPRKERRSTGF